MQDDNDEQRAIVAWIIGSAIVLSLAIALGSAIFGMNVAATPAPAAAAPAAPAAPAPVATAVATPAVAKVYFDTGSTALPADAAAALQPVIDAARANATATLAVSGFHDKTGDPARNAELAKERATAVRDAIVSAGIPDSRVALRKPTEMTGDAVDREARRVEVTVE